MHAVDTCECSSETRHTCTTSGVQRVGHSVATVVVILCSLPRLRGPRKGLSGFCGGETEVLQGDMLEG